MRDESAIAAYITRFNEIVKLGGEERKDAYRQSMIDMLDDPDVTECPIIITPETGMLFSIETRERTSFSLTRAGHALLHFVMGDDE